jgi:nucleotide-binding universal stress UspA family protein
MALGLLGPGVTGSIVCGVDGSPDAKLALRVAAHLSEQLGLRLVVAHVAQPVVVALRGSSPFAPSLATDDIAAAEDMVEQMVVDEGLVEAERRVAVGFPAERLADIADEERADLIVVGSRGRGPFKAAFLGSVSNELIGMARCPVVVVPRGADA